jgi:hypothetical protein
MTDTTTRTAGTVYVAPASKADLLAEGLGCIISGRPFPEYLQPPAPSTLRAAPTTVQEGIGRILAGPSN